MNNLLHKMCEKAEAELWELIGEDEWCLAHAEAAYYFVEIVKAIKKIEALECYEEEDEKVKEWHDEIPAHFTHTDWKRMYEEEKRKNEEMARRLPPAPPSSK